MLEVIHVACFLDAYSKIHPNNINIYPSELTPNSQLSSKEISLVDKKEGPSSEVVPYYRVINLDSYRLFRILLTDFICSGEGKF